MEQSFKVTGLDNVLDMLQKLPPEVASKRGGPVKLSLAKGARFLRDKIKPRLKAAIAIGGSHSTGLLEANVIASRGKQLYGGKGERYLIRVKGKTYPGRKGKPVTTRKTMALLEYGSAKQAATPVLRPSVQIHGEETINVVSNDLVKRVEKLAVKLGKGVG